MIGAPPRSLSGEEADAWRLYLKQRVQELKTAHPDSTDDARESIAWLEFVQTRWSFNCHNPFQDLDKASYARFVQGYGPDLRGMSTSTCRESQSVRGGPKKRPGHGKVGSKNGSEYMKYAKRRNQELMESNESMDPANAVTIIASEWMSRDVSKEEMISDTKVDKEDL